MEVRLLGQVEVDHDGRRLEPGRRRERCLLGLLLVQPGVVMSTDRLIDLLWDGEAPPSARATLHTAMSRLRSRLCPAGTAEAVTFRTVQGGYVAHVERHVVDVLRFRDLVHEAKQATEPQPRADLLRRALSLWRGPFLADVATPRLRERIGGELDELRMTAVEDLIAAELAGSRHREIIGELTRVTAEYPRNERLVGQLMLALYRSGRQFEALATYQRLRTLLADEIGLDPGPELRRLHTAILRNDAALNQPSTPATMIRQETPPVPRQLPPVVADFTGRQCTVERLEAILTGPATQLRVVSVSGPAGVGKSSLAWYAAHRLRPAFPDGQVYVDLRGTWSEAVGPFTALKRLLRAVGVQDAAQGDSVEERSAQFRDAVADKSMLVAIDDAVSAAHVRALLPGSASCAVIITSRHWLTGLEGAVHLALRTFEPEESLSLLVRIVGPPRADTEREALAEITELCGHLPLAIRIAGARLAARPHWRAALLAERLRDELVRLDELATDGLEVRASLGLSYRALPEPARRLLRLLSLLDAPDVPAWAGAAMLDAAPRDAEGLLESLADACLLDILPGADGEARYGMHDLVRLFAREKAAEEEGEQIGRLALRRAFGAWLSMAEDASARLPGSTVASIRGQATRWRSPAPRPSATNPVAWFVREHVALAASIHQAAGLGMADLAWELAASAQAYYELGGLHDDAQRTHQAALRATRRAGDRLGEAVMLRNLADLWTSRRGAEPQDKLDAAEAALDIFREIGEKRGLADALYLCADVHRSCGRHKQALALATEALSISTSVNYELGECHALAQQAFVVREQGRDAVAREMAERYLVLARKMAFRRDEGMALALLGLIHLELGEPASGKAHLERALAVARETGDRVQETYALARLGQVYVTLDRAVARHMLGVALDRSRTDGLAYGEALALSGIGELELANDRPQHAVASLRRAIQLLGELRFPFLRARALSTLGKAYAHCGETAAAAAAWATAYELFRQVDNETAAGRVAALLSALPRSTGCD
ncbi:BTAD domain-containing putative transcriptional regulator [Plantactinospora mayteni]|uniref:SARP family transcriptional regulator n=1 Tax=Plantactinospora mayteni TaxID=566021 RepID=A0ABQ4EUC9_9ACTN|nr:AfsR/SARP family transcriptional regulator [Plantactinospora mayteni]GIG98251.1 SARP family transcriptional regulator [Plantactinospora mayteni]